MEKTERHMVSVNQIGIWQVLTLIGSFKAEAMRLGRAAGFFHGLQSLRGGMKALLKALKNFKTKEVEKNDRKRS